MTPQTCPNCGDQLAPLLGFTKMVDCDSCGSTVILDGEALRHAGTRGEMLDAPSLIQVGRDVDIHGTRYSPVGHIRFDYGPGWWDEYWCLDGAGDGVWLSVDEGDIAFERPVPAERAPVLLSGNRAEFESRVFHQTEADRATCIAFRGQLPEVITLGETHEYVGYVTNEGQALSLERWTENGQQYEAWFEGDWLDPWQIRPVA